MMTAPESKLASRNKVPWMDHPGIPDGAPKRHRGPICHK
jgi:hypothetical protein